MINNIINIFFYIIIIKIWTYIIVKIFFRIMRKKITKQRTIFSVISILISSLSGIVVFIIVVSIKGIVVSNERIVVPIIVEGVL